MDIIFCDSGFSHKEPDYMYTGEFEAAKALGIGISLISYEALVKEGDANAATRRIPYSETPKTAIYRGWMLRPIEYTSLYDALLAKNIQLLNSPEQYNFAHYLPENYPTIADYTAKSSYLPLSYPMKVLDEEKVIQAVSIFGNSPIIIKDYVKSLKHHWEEACYISSASNKTEVIKKVRRFLELQGPDLNEGLVFREFLELEPIGLHPESAMPLTKEYRLFILDGKLIKAYPYWDEIDYQEEAPAWTNFESLFSQINNRFFTMDIAQTKAGTWVIMELGDGQVSGLPELADKKEFFQELINL
jgi:hypothetical protein